MATGLWKALPNWAQDIRILPWLGGGRGLVNGWCCAQGIRNQAQDLREAFRNWAQDIRIPHWGEAWLVAGAVRRVSVIGRRESVIERRISESFSVPGGRDLLHRHASRRLRRYRGRQRFSVIWRRIFVFRLGASPGAQCIRIWAQDLEKVSRNGALTPTR